jgi:hypothetical protein
MALSSNSAGPTIPASISAEAPNRPHKATRISPTPRLHAITNQRIAEIKTMYRM